MKNPCVSTANLSEFGALAGDGGLLVLEELEAQLVVELLAAVLRRLGFGLLCL